MIHVFVHIHVKADKLHQFINATKENAKNSILETGISQFDFLQQVEDQTRFLLIEVYRDEEAMKLHKETDHYRAWRDIVADIMVEPRFSQKYKLILPS
jgi:autoinducer 2-degrading protein